MSDKIIKTEFIVIPAIQGMPKITNQMKADCIGEFSWEEEAPYYDEDGNTVEYTAVRVVPWDVCKEIYKKMALSSKLSDN